MIDQAKVMLTPYVHNALVEENNKIRAEIREKGPMFEFTSINDRLRTAKRAAEAEEEAITRNP